MRRSAPFLLAIAAISGCGSDPPISASGRASAEALVAEVRAAVAAQHPEVAAQRLSELRSLVDTLQQHGQIDLDRAGVILAAVEGVEAQLGLLAPPATTTTAPSPPPVTAQTEGGAEKDEEEDKKDRGRGKRDD